MIIRYNQKKEGNAVLLSFFLRSLRTEYKYIEKKEKGKKKHTLLTLSIFCVLSCCSRGKRKRRRRKKNRNQRVSLSRSSFRLTYALYSSCLGALVRLCSPPSSLEFNFFFSFSLSCIRSLEIGFFLSLSPNNFLHHSVESIVVRVDR